MPSQAVTSLAEEWLRLDKDPQSREEMQQLIQSGSEEELVSRLQPRISFGTAGLRAKMEAGFARMNSLIIIQTSQGLAEYLLTEVPDAKGRGIVIGRDARHNSLKFAKLAAAVFVRKGFRVWWYELEVHTPLVPFGVDNLNAAAGVMVTASHNPGKDNGFKVYWANGCQINPPHDSGIANSIENHLETPADNWSFSPVDEDHLLVEGCLGRVRDAYYQAVIDTATLNGVAERLEQNGQSKDPIRFVYTAMHGVGLPYMARIVEMLGLAKNMVVVDSQAEPDPNFPTVEYPNPEEYGALNEAIATADAKGVNIILASDPDADRLAVAEKVEGRWHQFTGNQLGALLASHVIEIAPTDKHRSKLAMLASAVSSKILSTMAASEGFQYRETLTGFRWLGNAALDLQKDGIEAVFAFEEAIGYMFPGVVHDKDAVTAAAMFLVAIQNWQRQGKTASQRLHELHLKYGYHEDANTYLISPSVAKTNELFANIRALGKPHPHKLHHRRIHKWRDLTTGFDSSTKNNMPELPVSDKTQMITCDVDGNVRFTIRSSGTEPKIKLYVECVADSRDKAKREATEVTHSIIEEWFKPEQNGLTAAKG